MALSAPNGGVEPQRYEGLPLAGRLLGSGRQDADRGAGSPPSATLDGVAARSITRAALVTSSAMVDHQLAKKLPVTNATGIDSDGSDRERPPPPGRDTDASTCMRRSCHASMAALVSKDGDFVLSHVLVGVPARPLLVSTGNVSNVELEHLMLSNLEEIVKAFDSTSFVELTRTGIILRER